MRALQETDSEPVTAAEAPTSAPEAAPILAPVPAPAVDRFADPEPNRAIGISFRRSYARRVASGFMHRYFSGDAILDIGYRGGDPNAVPITENAIGIELDYPGYDGVHLPFPDASQDTILAGHVLEHIPVYKPVLQDWYRVLRIGGFMVLILPHRHLFERVCDLPSRWNGDHKRFYTPASLLAEIEDALPVNGYRVRHLADNDFEFDYDRPLHQSPVGCYEIELVIEKIRRPDWSDLLHYPPAVQQTVDRLDELIFQAVAANLRQPNDGTRMISLMVAGFTYFTPWIRLKQRFCFDGAPELGGVAVGNAALMDAVRPLLGLVSVDTEVYAANHPDLKRAVDQGVLRDLRAHWVQSGYFEGRMGTRFDPFAGVT